MGYEVPDHGVPPAILVAARSLASKGPPSPDCLSCQNQALRRSPHLLRLHLGVPGLYQDLPAHSIAVDDPDHVLIRGSQYGGLLESGVFPPAAQVGQKGPM